MKNILVLTDFSSAALYAAEKALTIAAKLGAEVGLVNVYPISPYIPPIGDVVLPEITTEEMRAESMRKLARETRRLEQLLSPEASARLPIVRPVSLRGQLAECVAVLARRKKSLLIVMGVSGRAYGDLFFSGEIKAVVQQVRCPVLAIPPQWAGTSIKHILFATDLTVADEAVIGKLAGFSASVNAQLSIGHVSPMVLVADFAEEVRNSTFSERIKSLYPAISYTNLKSSKIMSGLQKIKAGKQADVIALRCRKHPFWYRLFHQNPLKELIEQGSMPLLIYPENTDRHE